MDDKREWGNLYDQWHREKNNFPRGVFNQTRMLDIQIGHNPNYANIWVMEFEEKSKRHLEVGAGQCSGHYNSGFYNEFSNVVGFSRLLFGAEREKKEITLFRVIGNVYERVRYDVPVINLRERPEPKREERGGFIARLFGKRTRR